MKTGGESMKISHRRFYIRFSILFFSLIFSLTSCCGLSERAATEETKGAPSSGRDVGLPERIILNVTETPSISQAVTWRTRGETINPMAQIAPAADFSALKENLKTITATGEKVHLEKEEIVYHYAAVFKDLAPGTRYVYRVVGADENWSEWNQFQTAAVGRDPFTFVYFGDPQEEIKSMCSPIFRAAYKKAPDAQFWLITGDLVDNGDRDGEWDELFYALGWIPRTTPMMVVPGNHEYPDKRYLKGSDYRIFDLWRPHFTLPENGPSGLEETVYYIDSQGVRFVMLNGNERLEEQARWLDGILAANRQPWVIVGIHQPIYATSVRRNKEAENRNRLQLHDLMAPVFDKYSVDLVLQGHEHTYCRSYPIKNGRVAGNNEKGTTYVISVSGPKFYPTQTGNQELMAKTGIGRQLFQVIKIDRDRLNYTSFDMDGEVYDFFSLEK
jgi:acid phosphatase type 7